MFNINRLAAATAGAVLFSAATFSHAIPSLQLGIAAGSYDPVTETSIASSNAFSLYAYLIPNSRNLIGETYTISMALTPQVTSAANLGSFTVNGNQIDATSGMNYGIPPADATIETTPGGDSHDLQTHSVFPTFFVEKSFTFSVANQSGQFNTADHPSLGPQPGTGMYFAKFDIDVTKLNVNYAVHFDLYKTKPIVKETCVGKGKGKVCTKIPTGELDVAAFAPFSHDAQSGHGGGGPPNETSEPAILLIFLLGLIYLFTVRRKR